MISLTKYSIFKEDDESIEQLLEELEYNMGRFVEKNLDTSTSLIYIEGTDEVLIKILKLNEHSN